MATTLSGYNEKQSFVYEMRESRLKKCARIIQSLTPGKMLDIGCCDGSWLRMWQSRGWEPYGIDVSRANVTAASQYVDARVCDLNSDRFPFDDHTFDLIFAGEIIEHLVDTDGFLSEISRCVKPGGHVVITTPNLVSFENRLRIMLGIYPIWVNYNLEGSGHVRAYTPRILKKQMAAHGLKVTKHVGNWVPFLPQRFVHDVRFPWLAFTGDLLPSLSMDIIVLATKVS
jgi:2-polyprenyl-3-methyl-5-hydroxy-6-metoxy-1,4-benzoquinol methylase